jgi:Spy/CpxP family protein refolding chaperone
MTRKTLAVILAVLAIISLSMLSTFVYERWFGAGRRQPQRRPAHPFALLRGELALTKEQISRLEARRKAVEDEFRGTREQLRDKRMALMESLRADAPDTLGINRVVEEIGALQVELEKRMIRHMLEEQRTLTPEQRQKLHLLLHKHFSKMEGVQWMGPGGGPGDGMRPGLGRDGRPGRGRHRGPGREPGMGPGPGSEPGRFPPPDSARGMGTGRGSR